MRYFVDAEFNEYGGALLSIALVGEDGSEFYEVAQFHGKLGDWVKEHVAPKFGKAAIPWLVVQAELHRFLSAERNHTFVADWPADFLHLCDLMTYPGGKSFPFSHYVFDLIETGKIEPENPHNALSDARALRDYFCKVKEAV